LKIIINKDVLSLLKMILIWVEFIDFDECVF
jgi:hypothetical protein